MSIKSYRVAISKEVAALKDLGALRDNLTCCVGQAGWVLGKDACAHLNLFCR